MIKIDYPSGVYNFVMTLHDDSKLHSRFVVVD